MLHDGAEDRGFQMLPLALTFRDGDEVVAEEDARNARNLEQPPRILATGSLYFAGEVLAANRTQPQ